MNLVSMKRRHTPRQAAVHPRHCRIKTGTKLSRSIVKTNAYALNLIRSELRGITFEIKNQKRS